MCQRCGCHTARELAQHLAAEPAPRRSCPIARFLRTCGQLGIEARLPTCLSIGRVERETSWHGLLIHLRRETSAPGADESLEADMACVDAAWTAIRRRLGRCGIRQPRQLVLDPRANPVIWLLPQKLARLPRWLHPLQRVLSVAKTAKLFPRLDRGEGVPEVPVHQTLLHDILTGLNRPEPNVAALFADVRWEAVRSTAPLAVWRRTMQYHGLESLTSADDISHK